MKINNLPQEFKNARPIMQRIDRSGYQAYFVGGSVRDTILGNHIHDVDIASSAYPAEIKKLFHKTIDTGIQHGTVMVMDHGNGYEITTFRTESGYQDYRRPSNVKFIRSLDDDLKRRDFTINALAMKEDGEVTDLFGGLDDLNNHLIKAVGDPNVRFNEDALRMMRAVRFASKLNFSIESNTLAAIKRHNYLLSKIALERIHTEFVKMMFGMNPSYGLNDIINTDLYKFLPYFENHLNELKDIANIHNLDLNDEVSVWSLISYIFNYNSKEIDKFLRKWKTSNQIIHQVKIVCNCLNLMKKGELNNLLLYKTGLPLLKISNNIADQLGFGKSWYAILKKYNNLPIKQRKELKINGNILIKEKVIPPSPKLGTLLNHLEELVVMNELPNQSDDLLNKAKQIVK